MNQGDDRAMCLQLEKECGAAQDALSALEAWISENPQQWVMRKDVRAVISVAAQPEEKTVGCEPTVRDVCEHGLYWQENCTECGRPVAAEPEEKREA